MENQPRSAAERAKLIEAYRASGLSAGAFAAQSRISKSTFYNWLYKSNQRAVPVKVARVVRDETAVCQSPGAQAAATSVVLECGGVRVQVNSDFSPSALAAVLNLLEARAKGDKR